MHTREIILIDDDAEDIEIFEHAYAETGFSNKLVTFTDPFKALEYIVSPLSRPLLVISDVNMPRLNGFQLRDRIVADSQLRKRCFPFVFLSTSDAPENVNQAFDHGAQGYFVKEPSYSRLAATLSTMIEYWRKGKRPV